MRPPAGPGPAPAGALECHLPPRIGVGVLHTNGTALEFETVHHADSLSRICGFAERHKPETPAAVRVSVVHNPGIVDAAETIESFLECHAVDLESKIAHEQPSLCN